MVLRLNDAMAYYCGAITDLYGDMTSRYGATTL